MEQIIKKLAEIETAAGHIMDDAERRKHALSEEMEKQCREFDSALEEETAQKIEQIKKQLLQDKETHLQKLRKETQEHNDQIDSYYRQNHQRLAKEVLGERLHS